MAEKAFVPLYKKVYLDMKEKILNQTVAPGAKLPCERELCEQYGVKRVTIRKALELLAQEELIVKRMGLGSFVTSGSENAPEGTVGEGSVVTIELNGNEMTYVLGSRDIVAGTDYDIMTPDSPIGKAIEGAKVGDVVSYTAPNGRELSVTVKAAKPLA